MTNSNRTTLLDSPRAGSVAEETAAVALSSVEGVTIEVLEGPMDGSQLVGPFDSISIHREQPAEVRPNQLVLWNDDLVSADHAVVERSAETGEWELTDLGSTNGTWLNGECFASESRRLGLGTAFLVGRAVVKLRAGVRGETFNLNPAELTDRVRECVGRFSADAYQGWSAAAGFAAAARKSYLDELHLFLGLAQVGCENPLFGRGSGEINRAILDELRFGSGMLTGHPPWVYELLQANIVDGAAPAERLHEPLFLEDYEYSPRLLVVLQTASELAANARSAHITSSHLLEASLRVRPTRPLQTLEMNGLDTPALAATASRAHLQGSSTSQPVVGRALTTGDLELDRAAQEMARKLEGVSSTYHLAQPEDRRRAIHKSLQVAIAELPSSKRARFLGQLGNLFPVREPPETPIVAPPREKPPRSAPSSGLDAVFSENGKAERLLASLSPLERSQAIFLRDVLDFARGAELLITAAAHQTISGPTTTITGLERLPGVKTSIPDLLAELSGKKGAGKVDSADYFDSVRNWLVAIFTANHLAPEKWFQEFWAKNGPVAFEKRHKKGRGLLRGLDVWGAYRDAVQYVTPEEVAEEFHVIVKRIARERYRLQRGGK